MIDLETHCIVDIIDSRETDTVAAWLKEYPNIEIIVRDGSFGYRAAIDAAHPSAIQINDRFHIIKNLVKAITKTLKREMPGRIEVPLTSEAAKKRYEYLMGLSRRELILEAKKLHSSNVSKNEISRQLGVGITTITKYIKMKEAKIPKESVDIREQEHINAVNKINAKVAEVKALHDAGMKITDISIKTGYTSERIRCYLEDGFDPCHGQYGISRPGKLEPYREEVITLRAEGSTYKAIADIISKKGYTGSVDALRVFIAKEKRITKDLDKNKKPMEFINKRYVHKLLYRPIEKVKGITEEQLNEVIKQYPVYGDLLTSLSNFRDIFSKKKEENLITWIKNATALDINEINSYISGLVADYDSIKNAIIYNYSNGLAEGSVNKIKSIKRIMYGRNKFTLLRRKVLALEALK